MTNYTDDLAGALTRTIEAALNERIKTIVDEEAVEAGRRATTRVRELAVETCATIRSKLDINFYNGREIHIKLTLDDKATPR